MVKITDMNDGILEKIKEGNGNEMNIKLLNSYVDMRKFYIKRQYELCRQHLKNKKIVERDKYRIARTVVEGINVVNMRRDNYVRFLSLLLVVTGGMVSYVCYTNTDSVYKSLNRVYILIDDTIMSNSTKYYEMMSLDDNRYIIGYIFTMSNMILKVVLMVIDVLKFIIMSFLGIFLGLTEIGSVAISSVVFFITVVFTMCMIKIMNSSISIGITGTHIRDERTVVDMGSVGNVLENYFKPCVVDDY